MVDQALENLQRSIHHALKLWYKSTLVGSPLASLAVIQSALRQGYPANQAIHQVLSQAMDLLAGEAPESAALLRLRFVEEKSVAAVASDFYMAESTFYLKQREAVEQLTRIVSRMERVAASQQQRLLDHRLPRPSYTHLVGVEQAIAQLRAILLAPTPPWLIGIEGLGGIGKTALADTIIRQLVQAGSVGDFAWVSAPRSILHLSGSLEGSSGPALTVDKLIATVLEQLMGSELFLVDTLSTQEALTKLQSRLKEFPHLIIIDNLETIPDVERLLPTLRRLASPTKFLLTSRQSLYGEPDLYHFVVPELSEEDALLLVRQEARLCNLAHIAASPEETLRPLYHAVGGNPLALRLLIGQLHIHDLPTMVADVMAARGETIENLYRHIYQRAWDYLDESTRRIFLATPLLSERGGSLAHLVAVSQAEPTEVQRALSHLMKLNLVDARGSVGSWHYTIHSLTRSFLQEQVARWL